MGSTVGRHIQGGLPGDPTLAVDRKGSGKHDWAPTVFSAVRKGLGSRPRPVRRVGEGRGTVAVELEVEAPNCLGPALTVLGGGRPGAGEAGIEAQTSYRGTQPSPLPVPAGLAARQWLLGLGFFLCRMGSAMLSGVAGAGVTITEPLCLGPQVWGTSCPCLSLCPWLVGPAPVPSGQHCANLSQSTWAICPQQVGLAARWRLGGVSSPPCLALPHGLRMGTGCGRLDSHCPGEARRVQSQVSVGGLPGTHLGGAQKDPSRARWARRERDGFWM